MRQKQKESNYKCLNEKQEQILQKEFNFGPNRKKYKKIKLIYIIDWIIDYVKNKRDDSDVLDCIRKYWFTKQIEEWKNNNQTNEEPNNDKLMDIVKEDLKVRIANTMLELEKQKGINEENIWFHESGNYVSLQHDDDDICLVSGFNNAFHHASPPYKPFFTNSPNDKNKLNCVYIYKHGDDKSKKKWITAHFKDHCASIQFQTNENDKITNVEIENKKDSDSESTYTISLNNNTGEVEKITKEGEEVNDAGYKEINNLLFKDKINKHLTENIECELDNQQKVVFYKIKEYLLGIEKDTKKEKKEKNKEEEKEKKEEDNKFNNTYNKIIVNSINNKQSNAGIKEANTRKLFDRYPAEDGRKYFSCGCFDIPL